MPSWRLKKGWSDEEDTVDRRGSSGSSSVPTADTASHVGKGKQKGKGKFGKAKHSDPRVLSTDLPGQPQGKAKAKGKEDSAKGSAKGKAGGRGIWEPRGRDFHQTGKAKGKASGKGNRQLAVGETYVVRRVVDNHKPGILIQRGEQEEIFKPLFLFESWPLKPRIGDHLVQSSGGAMRLVQVGDMPETDLFTFLNGFSQKCEEPDLGSACFDMWTHYYPYMQHILQLRDEELTLDAHQVVSILSRLARCTATECPEWRILSDAVKSPFVRETMPALLKDHSVDVEQCTQLCTGVIQADPRLSCFLMPLLDATMSARSLSCRSDREWLSRILHAMSDGLAKSAGHHEAVSWRSMSVVPHLLSADLADIADLPRAKTSYKSPEEYLDTMFRLLRANCFLKLQRGVTDFLAGQLDFRDMMVYTAEIKGVALLSRGTGFVITTRCKAFKGNLRPRSLLFGNLVCLSLGTSPFEHVVWAKVVERPAPKRKVSVVDVSLHFPDELNRFQGMELLMQLLQSTGRKYIMAESPVYFQAYSAVFKVLQGLQPDQLPLGDLISSGGLQQADSVPWAEQALDYYQRKVAPSIEPNPSQSTAIDLMLRQPLTTIQGPPGTGKTFVGLKVVETLASMHRGEPAGGDIFSLGGRFLGDIGRSLGLSGDSDGDSDDVHYDMRHAPSQPPVLVLCYKNHALDEFLSSCSKFTSRIVRIGGRGSETLQQFNLRELAREKDKGKGVKKELWECITEKKAVANDIGRAMSRMCASTKPERVFFERASDEQLQSLVCGCPGRHRRHAAVVRSLQSGRREEVVVEDVEKCYALWSQGLGAHVDDDTATVFQQAEQEDDDQSADEEQEERKGHEDKVEKHTLSMPAWGAIGGVSQSNEIDVMSCDDVWSLATAERAALLRTWITCAASTFRAVLEEKVRTYDALSARVEDLERNHKLSILRKAQVVGATITGASIHVQLLRAVGFRVVMIEEAAEILEPLTIAAIPPSVQQVILIGDHKQLRPLLEVDELGKRNALDISLMERLIKTHYNKPCAQLTTQNRMRAEMVELIRDIYPKLQTNHDRVRKHLPVPGFAKGAAMFFYDTTGYDSEPSQEGRSLCNPREADDIVECVGFLCFEGMEQQKITVISMYKGQRWLLNRKLEQKGFPDVIVETVDRYQGDENDVVLVSLVRSDKSTSFVNTQNRRCVAASRAHRCVVFFGAVDMLQSQATHWRQVITETKSRGLLDQTFPIECPRHPGVRLPLGHRCQHVCQQWLGCGHTCRKPCHRVGAHPPCEEKVSDVFPRCGHRVERICSKDLSELVCKEKVTFFHAVCNHSGTRLCHQPVGKCREQVAVRCDRCGKEGSASCADHREKPHAYKCRHPCALNMSCGHPCVLPCSKECDEGLDDCKVCAEERKQATQRINEEIDRQIDSLQTGDGIRYSELTGSDFSDVERKVAAFYASSGLEPSVTKVVKVTSPDRERKFLVSSQRCNALKEVEQHFLHVASEDVAKVATESGLVEADKKVWQNYVEFHSTTPNSKPGRYCLLLCRVQLGRVYEHGVRGNNSAFDRKPPTEFDSGFDGKGRRYRLWNASRVLPVCIVHVDARAANGLPSHWTASKTPTQGWSAVHVTDHYTLKALRDCLTTDGRQLGTGRDVREGGRYSRLELSIAWRLEHPALWLKYATERNSMAEQISTRNLQIPSAEIRRELKEAAAKLPDAVRADVNEHRLLHATKPDSLLAILSNGINERFSGGLFGHGSYFAEDAGKNDQYVSADSRYGGSFKGLHERLFRDGVEHPNEAVYYILVCRVLLGHFTSTRDGSTSISGGGNIFAGSGQRELSEIPNTSPPLHFHALVAETGDRILRYREFIQFHDTRVFPEYLIAYRRR